eukprot:m.182727 g.182727  ORF g.182727 m.182727 type:complete len:408 (+) comp13591_c8_seq3:658-1881(+)
MSEKKGGIFRKMTTAVGRQQEKLRHKLKGDDYDDEEFQDHVANFNAQQAHAQRLLKEAQHFLKALKAMEAASRSFGEAIKVVYDPDWPSSTNVYDNLGAVSQIYTELTSRLSDEVVEPMNAYISRFPDIRARVHKRERRLLSYERAKRTLDHAKTKENKAKLQQAEIAFAEAETKFHDVDEECRQTLPSFYQGRVSMYGSVLQSCFSHQSVFHGACQSVNDELQVCVDSVLEQHASMPVPQQAPKQKEVDADDSHYVDDRQIEELVSGFSKTDVTEEEIEQQDEELEEVKDVPSSNVEEHEEEHEEEHDEEHDEEHEEELQIDESAQQQQPHADVADQDEDEDEVLEVRIATHAYVGQDDDELTFDKNATIYVIPFDDPDDEEEGWLYGKFEGKKGLFPQNHTKPND